MEPNQNVSAGNQTAMAVLAYIGPLVIISYLMAKNDEFVKFHIKQGLVLLVISIILWVLSSMFLFSLYSIIQLLNLGVLVLAIIGIVNAVQGKEKLLPLVGQFGSKFNI